MVSTTVARMLPRGIGEQVRARMAGVAVHSVPWPARCMSVPTAARYLRLSNVLS